MTDVFTNNTNRWDSTSLIHPIMDRRQQQQQKEERKRMIFFFEWLNEWMRENKAHTIVFPFYSFIFISSVWLSLSVAVVVGNDVWNNCQSDSIPNREK